MWPCERPGRPEQVRSAWPAGGSRRSPSGWWSTKGSGAFCRIELAMVGPRRCAQTQAMGLPVSLPLMDLDDNMAVTATDVWGRFADPVLKASQRYGAEMVVLGKLSPEGRPGASTGVFMVPSRGRRQES